MDPRDAITLLLLFAIPIGVVVVLRRPPRRMSVLSRGEGPLAAVVGGLALVAWVWLFGPEGSQPFLIAGAVIAGVGLVWHLARTIRRLNRAQA
jgi:hypothetical protein